MTLTLTYVAMSVVKYRKSYYKCLGRYHTIRAILCTLPEIPLYYIGDDDADDFLPEGMFIGFYATWG